MAIKEKTVRIWWKEDGCFRERDFLSAKQARVVKAELHQKGIRRVDMQTIIKKKIPIVL